MLQPLGISAEAEAVYVALGPLPSASVAELARLTSADTRTRWPKPSRSCGSSGWRRIRRLDTGGRLPLLDVVNQLKAQRLSEIELASVAAESLDSHLLAGRSERRPTTSRSSSDASPSSPLIASCWTLRAARSAPSTSRRTHKHVPTSPRRR